VLSVDLPKLIDGAAGQPERFAIEVPHQANLTSAGAWSANSGLRTWSYQIQVPTAVSLSFHASSATLPPSAVLKVSGSRVNVTYRAGDLARGELWSRPLLGDTLTLSLTVASSEASLAQLQIDSVQVGYRGLGGVADHPYFTKRQKATAAATQSCTENYSCYANTANQGPANATVALLVGNQIQCTGTLLNNTRNDRAPLILTARHCQNGKMGGGAPQMASAITVYWDAVTACGSSLETIYDGSAPAQRGAATLVEQQDAWLVQLDSAPLANDAFWAGWDATGGAFTGGYSIHHALGYKKQYVGWYGQSLAQSFSGKTLGVGYNSNFWGLVNQVGSVGSGSSGGAVFDSNNRVVGSSTLANLQSSGDSSPGVCPATTPSAPNSQTVTAQYTSLAAVFSSTADPTSTTGSATLQSVLDPLHTGGLTNDGAGTMPVTLNANSTNLDTFHSLTLTWSVADADVCTANGGLAGDGWSGAKPTSGTITISNLSGGLVTYSLTCSKGNLSGTSNAAVTWVKVAPIVNLVGPVGAASVGSPMFFAWSSNVAPCVASGGTNSDGWAGTKANSSTTQSVTATQVGTITYTMTCGTGQQTATAQVTQSVVPLAVTLTANATKVIVGSYVNLQWVSPGSGGVCTTSGGATGDRWASSVPLSATNLLRVTETVAGSFTYTVNCSSGSQSVSSSTSVVFTNDAPSVSLTAVAPTQEIYSNTGNVAPSVDLRWSSNITDCTLAARGAVTSSPVKLDGTYPSGTASDVESVAGDYTYTLQCGIYSATAAITWITNSPKAALTTSTSTWLVNSPHFVNWTTNVEPCNLTGGSAGDGWSGSAYGPGGQTIAESQAGNYTYTITCGTGSSLVKASLPVTVVTAVPTQLSASATSVAVNTPVTLAWTSTTTDSCTLTSSIASNWTGTYGPNGTKEVTSNATGPMIYWVDCTSGSAQITITYTAPTGSVQTSAPPTVLLTSSTTQQIVGHSVTLNWTSQSTSACTASGGVSGDGWAGSLPLTGNIQLVENAAGTDTYRIQCTGATSSVASQVTVQFTTSGATTSSENSATNSSSSDTGNSSGGGGGAIDEMVLATLALSIAITRGRSRRQLD
jgi:hypothetical protein